jgi:3-oxoacyl-[acyl-carrier protein] reductase
VDDLISQIAKLDNNAAAIAICGDLRNIEVPAQIVRETISAFGIHIDILVNNAGKELAKPMTEITAEEFTDVYNLNVRAVHLLTQAVAPHLRAPARIINISSVGARAGFANLSAYCSSKAALEGLTRVWAAEFGANGTTVNAVAPGPVESDMLANIPKEIVDMQKGSTPVQKRVGTPQEVADVVSWLASVESSWVSGQVLNVSGGWTMY